MQKHLRFFGERLRKLESLVGLTVFGLFFISSMLLNHTVQALNVAAGNYGYYLGTYGYQALSGHAVSDDVPKPPTVLTTSGITTAAITFSWTAPTQTRSSTSLGNLSGYCYKTGSTAPSDCTLTDSTTTATNVKLTGLSANSTRFINVRAYDANSNLSATALTGSATTNAEVGGGGGGGAAASVGPAAGAGAPAAPATAPAAPAAPTGPGAVAPLVSSLRGLSAGQLGDPKQVAGALGVGESAVRAKVGEAAKAAAAELKALGVTLGGELEKPFSTSLAALGVVNPELSTARGKAGFVRDVATVLGTGLLKAAQKDAQTAKIVVDIVTSTALGAPLDRRTIDQQCKECGKVLLSAEQAVVKDGVFQKLLGRLPKSADEFNLIKVIAYRGRVVKRDVARELASRVLYERTFGVNIAKLAQSKKAADVARVGEAWSVVRALAASSLNIPVKKASKPGTR